MGAGEVLDRGERGVPAPELGVAEPAQHGGGVPFVPGPPAPQKESVATYLRGVGHERQPFSGAVKVWTAKSRTGR